MPLPEHSRMLGLPENNLGGWLSGLLDAIRHIPDVSIAVASSVTKNKCQFSVHDNDNVRFYAVPCSNMQECNAETVEMYRRINDEWHPDLVHFHGSEYFHGLLAVKHVFSAPCLLSIQGILSGSYPWCCGNLFDREIQKTLKDKLLNRSCFSRKQLWKRCAERERLIWQNIRYFGGRTEWDRSFVRVLNPSGRYFHMPELLRAEFYQNSHSRQKEQVIPYSIFCNLSCDPLKGAHLLLAAAAHLKKKYPVRLFALGKKPPERNLKSVLLGNSYPNYLGRLIREGGLADSIEWLGSIPASEMIHHFVHCSVYAHTSMIENSSNAVCEAQMCGCPVVAFHCGGIPSLVQSGETGLLASHGDIYDLCDKLETMMTNTDLAEKISQKARIVASSRHDKETSVRTIMNAYKTIIDAEKE